MFFFFLLILLFCCLFVYNCCCMFLFLLFVFFVFGSAGCLLAFANFVVCFSGFSVLTFRYQDKPQGQWMRSKKTCMQSRWRKDATCKAIYGVHGIQTGEAHRKVVDLVGGQSRDRSIDLVPVGFSWIFQVPKLPTPVDLLAFPKGRPGRRLCPSSIRRAAGGKSSKRAGS